MSKEQLPGSYIEPEGNKNGFVRTLENTAVVKYAAFVGGAIGILGIVIDGMNKNNNAFGSEAFAFTVACAIIAGGAGVIDGAEKTKPRF